MAASPLGVGEALLELAEALLSEDGDDFAEGADFDAPPLGAELRDAELADGALEDTAVMGSLLSCKRALSNPRFSYGRGIAKGVTCISISPTDRERCDM